jgi:hypothetical protein
MAITTPPVFLATTY